MSYTAGGGLPWATVIKWLLVLMAIPPLLKAWQAFGSQSVTAGYGGPDTQFIQGDAAIRYGWVSLAWSLGFIVAAVLVWYYWERNTD